MLFWRARLSLIQDYEPLIPSSFAHGPDNQPYVEEFDAGTMLHYSEYDNHTPSSWQYRCLVAQESLAGSLIIIGVVMFDIFYANQESEDAGLAVTLFFVVEICLRYYNWRHCYNERTSRKVGNFFFHPFRLFEFIVVLIDVVLLALGALDSVFIEVLHTSSRLARFLRLLRAARWLKCLKGLRSMRMCNKFLDKIKDHASPTTRQATLKLRGAIQDSLRVVEDQKSSWNGRTVDPEKKAKLERELAYLEQKDKFATLHAASVEHRKEIKELKEHIKKIEELITKSNDRQMEESERHVKELNSKYERVIADAADGRKQQDGNNSKIRTLIEETSIIQKERLHKLLKLAGDRNARHTEHRSTDIKRAALRIPGDS
mmetsp:Transcript_9704/g.22141  ORF Transcript_9704/g.22141 Transcript_9704/m.22141 type:complete len:373 (-) Transcript_9704:165-1283(-)